MTVSYAVVFRQPAGRAQTFGTAHSTRWFTVYRGLTADECFREIEGNEVFWPVT
ncbi:MAG: hypothetical protein ABI051_04375 [Vicinamibacterales bacterium]